MSEKKSYLNRKENLSHSKYGILNVGKNTNKSVITGFVWTYRYFDGERIRVITSYDLIKLRKKVESIGKKWIVLDLKKAKRSYEINREAMKLREDYLKKKRS